MDYLEHAFFERGDALVWANRGGGKTFYGAVATLLDMLFKPGISICVLGGSFAQSSLMHRYLRGMLERPGFGELIDGRFTQTGVRLINGSEVEVAAQSETSVRGRRVQKLRCDEIEQFDREVWEAAKFVTRGKRCGEVDVAGSVEVFSTMHRPYGLMRELVGGARAVVRDHAEAQGVCVGPEGQGSRGSGAEGDGSIPAGDAPVCCASVAGPGGRAWPLFKWCALDVMARCETWRDCERCRIHRWCGGAAKSAWGFVPVADVIRQCGRSDGAVFESEMLCLRPSRTEAVFDLFDPGRHVGAFEPADGLMWVGGMDFGMRNPFVMLWAQLRPMAAGMGVRVVDEYVADGSTVAQHLAAMAARPWPRPAWIGADPAGAQRNDQTGVSTISLVRAAGYTVRRRRSLLHEGIELLRWMIAPAEGEPLLMVHPRCEKLIESLTSYHFDTRRPESDQPIKDGADHAADALRYLAINLHGSGKVEARRY
jgi:hypothetical protein